MDLIKTGIGIHKTIRNVSRLREIVLVFARHGFAEFISSGATSKIPNFVLPKSARTIKQDLEDRPEKDWGQVIGFRVRKCFEELGPAFIKFGQLLSSREDIFDESFIDEMKILRDKVKPIPFEEVKEVLEKSLGHKVEDIFESIEHSPIGTASIGVVYKAKLKTGEDVVVKVRRPNIEKMIETDFSIMMYLALQAEKVSDEIKFLGVSRVLKDFAGSLPGELNFNIEALNASRFRQVIERVDNSGLFYIPIVHEEYNRENILIMEQLKGTPFSDVKTLEPHLKDLEPKLDAGIKIFMKTFLQEGFFHADLHGGNFFYLDNGNIGLIDFGLMGTLSKSGRKNFVAIIYSLLTFNYENLVYEFLDVAEYESIPDVDKLVIEIRDTLSPYIGLTVQQMDFGIVLQQIVSVLKRHQIFLPREWFIVFRALMTLDGVGRSLGMDFDIYSILEGDINEIIHDNFSKEDLIEDALWTAKDLLSSARILPRHLKWFIKDISKRKYAVELVLTGYEKQANSIVTSIHFLGFAMLTGIFTGSGVLVLGQSVIKHWRDVPTLSWIFWALGALMFFRGLKSLKKLKA